MCWKLWFCSHNQGRVGGNCESQERIPWHSLTEDLLETKWKHFQDFIKSYSPSAWFFPLLNIYACLTGRVAWEPSFEIYGSYKDVPRETFFHQKSYSPQLLESLPTTVDPANKDKTCQPAPVATDGRRTNDQLSKITEKFIWKTMMFYFIFLPGSAFQNMTMPGKVLY